MFFCWFLKAVIDSFDRFHSLRITAPWDLVVINAYCKLHIIFVIFSEIIYCLNLFLFIWLFLYDFMICTFSIYTVIGGNPAQFLSNWGGQKILTSGWLPASFRLIYGEFHKLSHTGVLFRHVWLSMLFVSFGHFWVLRNNRCPMHHKPSHDNIVCNN